MERQWNHFKLAVVKNVTKCFKNFSSVKGFCLKVSGHMSESTYQRPEDF